MTARARALWICDRFTVIDGDHAAATPADALGDFRSFLNRVAAAVEPEAVVLLDEHAIAALRLDKSPPAAARADGWATPDEWQPWVTFRRPADRGEIRLHVGLMPEIEPERFPLLAPFSAETTRRLVRWQHLAGAAYHGTPGVAGLEILRGFRHDRRRQPRWSTAGGWLSTIPHTAEQDYSPRQWGAVRGGPLGAVVGYDVNRAYLAAAGVALLAANDLQHVGRRDFDKSLAGYWLAELSPWAYGDRMPDPAGYAPRVGSIRWISTPTARLLDELTHAGVYAGFTVHDSWIAPGRRICEPWAATLNGICQHWHPIPDDPDGPAAIRATARAAYREAIGLFDRAGGTVYRPDWRHAIVATARANLWRKLWQLGQSADVWPLSINVDCVYYAEPVELPIGGQLGQFKLETRKDDAA